MREALAPGELDVAAGLWRDGLLLSDDLPELASEALSVGLDSPALRELAGVRRQDAPLYAPALFEVAIDELGITPLSPCDAKIRIARVFARSILNGELDPRTGANRVYWALGPDWDDSECSELRSEWLMLDDLYEWDDSDRPPREVMDRWVRQAAADLLAGRSSEARARRERRRDILGRRDREAMTHDEIVD